MRKIGIIGSALGAVLVACLSLGTTGASASVVAGSGTVQVGPAAIEIGASPLLGPSPLDANGCTGTLPTDQIENCVTITGDASYLDEVAGTAYTHNGSVYGHEEITGPSIPNGYMNSPNQTITTSDNGPLVTWDPDGSVTDGNYCAIFWQQVTGGYSENGPACEYVS